MSRFYVVETRRARSKVWAPWLHSTCTQRELATWFLVRALGIGGNAAGRIVAIDTKSMTVTEVKTYARGARNSERRKSEGKR